MVPFVLPGKLPAKEIKSRTNFSNEAEIMSFIIIVCNGDFDLITLSHSHILTWYEEWFFSFEMVWGRHLTSWMQGKSKKHYGVDNTILKNIFDEKCILF